MTEASRYLLALARRNAEAYIENPKTKAVMITGSCAEGESDFYSDIDTILYYEELPTDEELEAARLRNGGSALNWRLGDRTEGSVLASYNVQGVECQFAHSTIATWEREMATVLVGLDLTSPIQKALAGLLHAIPLHGEALIQRWQAQVADYPDTLARAMVEKHLQFVPLWALQPRLSTRDATLWRTQILVEAVQNLLGVLAGLNRLYYSTFQFKRMGRFIAEMRVAPPDLASRIERLFTAEPQAAADQLEALIAETVDLVAARMPDVDVSQTRKRLGRRPEPWRPAPEISRP